VLYLFVFANDRGVAWPSEATLGEAIGLGPRMVDQHRATLIEQGRLVRLKQGGGRRRGVAERGTVFRVVTGPQPVRDHAHDEEGAARKSSPKLARISTKNSRGFRPELAQVSTKTRAGFNIPLTGRCKSRRWRYTGDVLAGILRTEALDAW
jgi:hypothetical protein